MDGSENNDMYLGLVQTQGKKVIVCTSEQLETIRAEECAAKREAVQ